MMKHPVKFIYLLITAILIFLLSGCGSSSAKQSTNDNQYDVSDPLVVAEYALACISDGNIESFMNATPFYKSSYFYSELRTLVEACIDEMGSVEEFTYVYYDNLDVEKEVQDVFEAEGFGKITAAKEYRFKNIETEEWVSIYVGKIESQWHVCVLEYYVP